jgi:Helix-turn-helix domain
MTWQPELSFGAPETHRRPTQAGRILAHLRAGNRLTALDALESFGCFRLAARIHELRREGWAIEERTVETRGGKRVAEYSMGGGDE